MLSWRLDTRSLAIFRIGLGALILWDLFDRSRALIYHYTDVGVFPRPTNLSVFEIIPNWSLHVLSGSAEFQIGLFVVAAAAALALLLGFQTRAATVICWILTTSLQHRNPFILYGADEVLRLCLFWGIFLPLGRAFSLDRKSSQGEVIETPASALLIAQVVTIFFFAGVYKMFDSSWRNGQALSLALSAHPGWLADYFLQSKILPLATYAAVLIQLSAPLAIFTAARKWLVVLFILLQMTMGLLMDLAMFPFVCSVAWLALMPTELWDKFMKSSAEVLASPRRLFLVYATAVGLALPIVGHFESAFPTFVPLVLRTVGVNQNWRFFTPAPTQVNWLKVLGRKGEQPWIEAPRPQQDLDLRRPPLSYGWARARWGTLSNAIHLKPDLAFNLARITCQIAAGKLTTVRVLTVHQDLVLGGQLKTHQHAEFNCP